MNLKLGLIFDNCISTYKFAKAYESRVFLSNALYAFMFFISFFSGQSGFPSSSPVAYML